MKHIFTIFAFFFLFSSATAQVQWFAPEASWFYYNLTGWVGDGLEQHRVGVDSIINGKQYTKIISTVTHQRGGVYDYTRFVRQDGFQVFALNWHGSQEFKMYDFNLVVGDTIHMEYYPGVLISYVVTSVGIVQINGQQHRIQEVAWLYTDAYGGKLASKLIEGIGSVETTRIITGTAPRIDPSYFFLDEPSGFVADGVDRYFCSYTNTSGTYEGTSVNSCKSLGPQDPIVPWINLYPNPSKGTLRIFANTNLTYHLYAIDGREVPFEMIDQSTIHTAYKGFCILVAKQDGKQIGATKVQFY